MSNRIFKGCDQQGRYPEAAEACTEIGADDDLGESDIGKNFLIAFLLTSGVFCLTVTVAWLIP